MVGTRQVRLLASPDHSQVFWEATGQNAEAAVRSFLRLDDLELRTQGQSWSRRDPLFAQAWQNQPGVRLLRQDPHECFFSFLCASVAPIARIRTMLDGIAELAGANHGEGFIEFPSLEKLSALNESQLRDKGLGFRAARVVSAARQLRDTPPNWLEGLKDRPLEEIEKELTAFEGIGRKIADCIALFCLDANEAVPVDTHIWRIARTHYLPELAQATLTPTTYQQVHRAFVERFGSNAGWAQQILFYGQAVGGDRMAPK